MYPVKGSEHYGIFVKEQIDSLRNSIEKEIYFINAKSNSNIEYLKSIFRIPIQIKREKYDFIHIHYGLSGLFLLFYKPKITTYLTLHGGDILPAQKKYVIGFITKRVIKKVNKVFILNDEMRQIVSKYTSNFEILPCGVDVDFFNHFPNIKTQTNLFIFPSDPTRKVKDYPLFQNTINILKSSIPNIETKNIHNLNREGVRDLLNKATCMIMTSISEGSPQVIKEALSCGVPVVSTDVGDVARILDGISNCYVCPDRNPDSLAKLALKSIKNLNKSKIREQFLNKQEYDSVSITKRLEDFYFNRN